MGDSDHLGPALRLDERLQIRTIRTTGGLRVILKAGSLEQECGRRGWSLAELRRQTRLSIPSVQNAARGNPIMPLSFLKIRRAFRRDDLEEARGWEEPGDDPMRDLLPL